MAILKRISRYPVNRSDDLDIVGFIHAEDVFQLMEGEKAVSLKKILRP
jgi:Mg2+/Co2+ transporter CorC